ncbi:MAG: sensor histidine kinase [Candidatus Marinamargulisbacteria bacterium]
MIKLPYKNHLSYLSITFIIIIVGSITMGMLYGVKTTQLINKKIDNTSNILLLNSAIWDYQEFLRDLPTSTANKNSQLKDHKYHYTTTLDLIHQLLMKFESFNIQSNNKEKAIIAALYRIQTKVSELSFKTDAFIYSTNTINQTTPFVTYLTEEQRLLKQDLMALKQVNQTDIKAHMKRLIIRTILIAAMICITGFSLFSHFKRRLSVDLKQLESYSNTSEKNEIQAIISTLKATQQQLKNSNKTATECQIVVNEKSKQVQQVTEQLLHSQEAERQNISQFIHNDLGQHLTALNLETAVLESKVTSPDDLNQTKSLIQLSLKKIKAVSKYIHPPQFNHQSLSSVCQNHAKDILPDEITITMDSTSFTETNLTQAQKLSLFRTFQEAITNIVRHANASHIQVDLATTTTHHTLRITDDGIGISNATPSTGLTAIKHRIAMNNGTFDLKNNQPTGTTMTVTLPLELS